jgi:hypothetical protein
MSDHQSLNLFHLAALLAAPFYCVAFVTVLPSCISKETLLIIHISFGFGGSYVLGRAIMLPEHNRRSLREVMEEYKHLPRAS